MRKTFIIALAVVTLVLSAAVIALGQTTTVTKTVQNPDGTYSIIEYPVGKEVVVTLDPVSLPGAKGTVTVLRDPSGTTIKVNLSGLPTNVTSLNVYAVDPYGVPTLIGLVPITDGNGVLSTTAQLDKFMIVASPDTIATYTPETKVYFRSAVPEGFAVVPFSKNPIGEKVAAVSTSGETSAYSVPMLNIPAYRTGKDTKLSVNFTGEMEGARANVFIEPHKDGRTEVNFRFHDLKEAPRGQIFTVWAVSPDNHFEKLGQILNSRGRNEAEIKAETSLPDFGLLVTMEAPGEVVRPAGPRVSWVELMQRPAN
jgi:hypothetical protein